VTNSVDGSNHADALARLREHCAAVGFDLDAAGGSLVARMRLLAEHSHTFDDATRMVGYAEAIFGHDGTASATPPFSAIERQTVVLACIFSDVGKTGPENADEHDRRLVVEAFAVENVKDDAQTFAHFLAEYFPSDAAERTARFVALGLDPRMTLRQFWNQHSVWTLAIVEAAGLPLEAVAAAAAHHLLDDVNPRSIVGDDDRFTRRFGENVAFDRAEKLVVLLDKYDAVTRRGRKAHDEAITWLRDRIARSPRFGKDREFGELLARMGAVLGSP
jgi:hypothetical protein